MVNLPFMRPRQNKANSPEQTGGGARRPPVACPLGPAGQSRKTNPIRGRTGWGGAPGTWDTEPIVRNKANSRPGRLGRSLGDEGQTCETNPISPEGPGMGAGGRRRGEQDVRNEPNLARLGGAGAPAGERRKTNPIPAAGRGAGAKCAKQSQLPEPVVQNKPNLGDTIRRSRAEGLPWGGRTGRLSAEGRWAHRPTPVR
jgi:hypothetical protein